MIRNTSNFFRRVYGNHSFCYSRTPIRQFTRNSKVSSNFALLAAGTALSTGLFYYYKKDNFKFPTIISSVHAATVPESQTSVYSPTKKHALYLTIHLDPAANIKEVMKVICNIEKQIDIISPVDIRDEDDEILAGVGFSPNFLAKVRPGTPAPHNYSYHERKGKLGAMPSTGGDIFIHAKSNDYSKVFELAQTIMNALPLESVSKFEDIYGWVYKNGRDLSGFIDGTENPADEDHRREVAVNKETGGSFVITQKWLHQQHIITSEKDANMEGWVGRKRSDSSELKRKALTSHVARMTGGPNFEQKKEFEIVRQSQPFGRLCAQNGLFFIGYSADPVALNYMLDRMVGASEDGLSDDIMRLSICAASAYWYFPGAAEMKKLSSVYCR